MYIAGPTASPYPIVSRSSVNPVPHSAATTPQFGMILTSFSERAKDYGTNYPELLRGPALKAYNVARAGDEKAFISTIIDVATSAKEKDAFITPPPSNAHRSYRNAIAGNTIGTVLNNQKTASPIARRAIDKMLLGETLTRAEQAALAKKFPNLSGAIQSVYSADLPVQTVNLMLLATTQHFLEALSVKYPNPERFVKVLEDDVLKPLEAAEVPIPDMVVLSLIDALNANKGSESTSVVLPVDIKAAKAQVDGLLERFKGLWAGDKTP